MKTDKLILTIIGAILTIIGIGGAPVYAIQGDTFHFAVYTGFLVVGIILLGYAAKD